MIATLDLASLVLEQFQPLVNTDFLIRDHQVTAKLIEAQALKGASGSLKRLPFRLLFVTDGLATPMFRQGVMQLDHKELGTLELFMVAIGQRESGLAYEAIFN